MTKQFIIKTEARCLLSYYVTAKNKKEALERFHSGDSDRTEIEEVYEDIEIFID